MRPVNLLPPELRARAAGEGDPRVAYGVLGGLGLLLVMVLLAVMYSNQATTLQDEAAVLRAEAQRHQANVKPVQSFNDFADVVRKRTLLVGGLAASRFPWDSALYNLSRSMPEDVTLDQISASTAAGAVEGGQANASTMDLGGCASSWVGYSRFLVRMRNLPGVNEVIANDGSKQSAEAATPGGEEDDKVSRTKNCGLAPVKFTMKVVFDLQTVDLTDLPSVTGGSTAPGATGVTGATATPASAPAAGGAQ